MTLGFCIFAGFCIMVAWGDGFIRGRAKARRELEAKFAKVEELGRRARWVLQRAAELS